MEGEAIDTIVNTALGGTGVLVLFTLRLALRLAKRMDGMGSRIDALATRLDGPPRRQRSFADDECSNCGGTLPLPQPGDDRTHCTCLGRTDAPWVGPKRD